MRTNLLHFSTWTPTWLHQRLQQQQPRPTQPSLQRSSKQKKKKYCYGSMQFWCGSGSADLYFCLMDPDPDADPNPAIFVSDLQGVNKKFFCLLLFDGTFTSFSKIKAAGINVFLIIFAWWWRSGSGFVSLTNGSRSRSERPKNIRIIRIRIRIRNTEKSESYINWSQRCASFRYLSVDERP